MLTGRPPFQAPSPVETLDLVRSREPASPRSLQPRIPRDLETICLRCLQKEPEKRYGSAAELADDLDRFLEGRPIQARPVGRLERSWRWCRRNPLVASLWGAALVLLVATLASLAWGNLSTIRALAVARWQERQATEQRGLAETQRDRAEKALDTAVTQQRLAEERRRQTDAARADALAAWQLEQAQRKIAEEKQREADRARTEAERERAAADGAKEGEREQRKIAEQQRKTAEEKRLEADMLKRVAEQERDAARQAQEAEQKQRQIAEQQQALAEKFQKQAEAERDEAVRARTAEAWMRKRAERQTELARAALHRSQRQHFNAQLVRVQALWREQQHLATQLLNDPVCCPAQMRDFTWGLFYRLARPDRMTLRGHEGYVRAVAYSPDGRLLASVGTDRFVRIWDVATGKIWKSLEGHRAIINDVAFSPDGKWLATADGQVAGFDPEPGEIRLWNVNDGSLHKTLVGHTRHVVALAFSADGKRLASGNGGQIDRRKRLPDPTIRLWNVPDGELRAVLPCDSAVRALAFFPDQIRLAAAIAEWDSTRETDTAAIQVWDVVERKATASWKVGAPAVSSLAVSPDGNTLAYPNEGHSIDLVDVKSQERLRRLAGHATDVTCVTFSPTGDRLASSGSDGAVRIWEVATWHPYAEVQGDKAAVTCVAFSPVGGYLATAAASTIRLLQIEPGATRWSEPAHTLGTTGVAFAADNSCVVSVGHEPGKARITVEDRLGASRKVQEFRATQGAVKVWDPGTGRLARALPVPNDVPLSRVAVSPTGAHVLAGSPSHVGKGQVFVWELKSGELVHSDEVEFAKVWTVAFSPDGQSYAAGGLYYNKSASIEVRETISGKRLHSLTFDGVVASVAFSPDGTTLAAGGGDITGSAGRVEIWNVAEFRSRLLPDRNVDQAFVVQLAYSPDGKFLAIGDRAGKITLRDVRLTDAPRRLHAHTQSLTCLGYSSDGETLVSAGKDGKLRFWDPVTIESRGELEIQKPLNGISFSPDGQTVALGWDDGSVSVWETQLGTGVQTLHGHPGSVQQLRFADDGSLLMAWAGGETVCAWDVATGQIQILERLRNEPPCERRAVVLMGNGCSVASLDYDRVIRIWDTGLGQVVRRLEPQGRGDVAWDVAEDVGLIAASTSEKLQVWDIETGRLRFEHAIYSDGCAFSSDGRRLAGICGGQILVVDTATGGIIPNAVLDSYRAENALSFSSDDRWLAAGHDGAQPGDTSPIRIWDLTSGRIHLSLGVALEDVAELKFSPDSKWLLSINDKRGGRLWDTSTGQQRDSFKAAQSISHAEFSPDGVFVATAGPGCFELWNLESNRVQATLRGSITTFAFSPDRELLATGTANGDVQLWHVKYMNGEFEVPRSTE